MAKKSSVQREQPTQFAVDLLKSLAPSFVQTEEPHAAGQKFAMAMLDPYGVGEDEEKKGKRKEKPTLVKSILNMLNGNKDSIERLAFEADPSLANNYQGLFRQKRQLLPDIVLKRIMIQDDLVAAIINARANQLGTFGRPRPDRFSIGFDIEPNDGITDKLNDDQMAQLQKRIDIATKKFETCGSTKGWSDEEALTFSQYLTASTKNAVGLGRIATEIIYITNPQTGAKEFHSFRPIDAGTIFRAAPHKEAAQAVRDQALHLLEMLKNKKLEPERYVNDEYAWVQVIDGKPVQAFTSKECICHNFYLTIDVEMDGYPVTPLDTVISAVTTHINITAHNKLYFQSGRAARGMLVIKSEDVDENVIQRIRQQFNASINSVGNAWRMPVFGIGPEDDITWQPIDSGTRDMEFQYLSDTNARVILSAFQMSPEELPGYAHLSRGTNNQALSESNQEYLLIAHRDVGIRPLVAQWQDFINKKIFPLIDENLAKICTLKLIGLDAETAEKESIRIQQDQGVWMTPDDIMDKVEKKPIGAEFGGNFPLNPAIQAVMDKYCPVGAIRARFFNDAQAANDPQWAYVRDPFWFQWQQLQMQAQQQAQQTQMAQQGGGPPGGGGGGDDGGGSAPGGGGGDSGGSSSGGSAGGGDSGGSPPGGGDSGGSDSGSASASAQSAQQDDQLAAAQAGDDLSRSVDQAAAALQKHQGRVTPDEVLELARTHPQLIDALAKSILGPEEWKKRNDEFRAQLGVKLGKSEKQLSQNSRRVLAQHRAVVKNALEGFDEDTQKAIKEIVNVAEKHVPKHMRQ